MSLWNRNDASAGAPKFAASSVKGNDTVSNLFGNSTPSASIPGKVVGLFGVSAAEADANKKIGPAGWSLRSVGTGPAVSATITGVHSAYSNNDILRAVPPSPGVNAVFTIATNGSGANAVFTLSTSGSGFVVSTIPTANLFIVASGGGAAAGNTTVTNIVVTAGGRAGRVSFENLVAMGSLGAQTAPYGTPATTADASDSVLDS